MNGRRTANKRTKQPEPLQTKDLSEQLATDQPFGDREIGVLGDWGVRGFGAHSSRVSNPINRRLIDEQHCT